MSNAIATEARTAPDTSTGEFLAVLAGAETPEFAPGRVNNGRQASFDAVAAWNSVGRID